VGRAFQEALREARESFRISAAEVDRRTGSGTNTTSRLERGRLPPPRTRAEIDALADAVGADPDTLWALAVEHHVPDEMRDWLLSKAGRSPSRPAFVALVAAIDQRSTDDEDRDMWATALRQMVMRCVPADIIDANKSGLARATPALASFARAGVFGLGHMLHDLWFDLEWSDTEGSVPQPPPGVRPSTEPFWPPELVVSLIRALVSVRDRNAMIELLATWQRQAEVAAQLQRREGTYNP